VGYDLVVVVVSRLVYMNLAKSQFQYSSDCMFLYLNLEWNCVVKKKFVQQKFTVTSGVPLYYDFDELNTFLYILFFP
jgi:hypothetical protein